MEEGMKLKFMNKLIKLVCLIFSILFCVAVLPDIANAEDAVPANPFANAGMSAYVKLDSITESIFENAKANLFDSVENYSANYIVGLGNTYAYPGYNNAEVPLHIYLSTTGWLMVYLTADQEPSMIVNWDKQTPLGENLLKLAVEDAAKKIGATYNNSSVKYFDFEYPDAAKMTLVRENVSIQNTSNTFNVLVPGTIHHASYALASFGVGLNSYTRYVDLYIDKEPAGNINGDAFVYGAYDDARFTAGADHEIMLSKNMDEYPASAVTLILYSIN